MVVPEAAVSGATFWEGPLELPVRPDSARVCCAVGYNPAGRELPERLQLSVRIRLTRVGARNNPVWRVVAADQRSPRDGRFIEVLGHYNPQTDPSTIELDEERVRNWLRKGAEPSDTVKQLLKAKGIA
jgi:small subunit ribosomal protein S16